MVDFHADGADVNTEATLVPEARSRVADNHWASPPEPINQILDAPSTPAVLISPDNQWFVELEQPSLPSIAELAEPKIAVAGLRLNPRLNSPARHHTYRSMTLHAIESGVSKPIPLPDEARISYVRWSLDGQKLAFVLTQATGLELWFLELSDGIPHQLTKPILNATYGIPYRWLSHEQLLCKFIPADRGAPPEKPSIPTGPIIQENLGRKTASRTYTNLLQNPYDEQLFEYYVTSTLGLVTLDGRQQLLGEPGLIDEAIPSPDGTYILLTTLHRPFSYQLPSSYFPLRFQVLAATGQLVCELVDRPLADAVSTKFDAVVAGPRRMCWRSDRPATLYWVEALDGGDPDQTVPYRDALYELNAPFAEPPKELWRSQYRFRRVRWGNETVALVWERWHDTRQLRMWRLNPAQPEALQCLGERSYEDQYSDPGMPLTEPGPFGRSVLQFALDGNSLYFTGRGASPTGVYPFLDRLDLTTGTTDRLWQSQSPYLESVVKLLDNEARQFFTLRQSQTEPPNFFRHTRSQVQPVPLTAYPDRAPQFASMQKQVVRYQRADGVHLSAKLYLPAGYDPAQDGPLPTVFWIYPEEFKNRDLAGQITTAEHAFSRPSGTSVLFLLTQGYAVLSNPSLPIIGEGDAEPNDTYVEQLLTGIQAAIDYVVERGVADRDRLAIGGHSYGAFTTANILAHSNWFRAGIARSGAYNRTLTPFGFQGEQRHFWEAAETYMHMSPFTHVSKITAPLLLLHGADDSNAGTYPLQTERFYEALKGLGATVRQVILPLEDHGYHSREAVGHVLWEMVRWCDRYLKEAG
jgi:dipeptidyl aminopeptidase/acylaminoacyl peptidase